MLVFLPTRGTPYDLRFSLLGIPVTVSPFFWLVAALFGFDWLYVEPGGPANLIAWVLCVFVSILLHEFGHAFTMRGYGHEPEVVLHHFGGYATYRGRETPWRSLVISAAGPGVQLALWAALAFGLVPWLQETARFPEAGTPLFAALISLQFINLYWALLNLLPVLPLDGGRILHALLGIADIRDADRWAVKVSIVIGIGAAVYFLIVGNRFIIGAMFAFMAMDNYQTLKGRQFRPW